ERRVCYGAAIAVVPDGGEDIGNGGLCGGAARHKTARRAGWEGDKARPSKRGRDFAHRLHRHMKPLCQSVRRPGRLPALEGFMDEEKRLHRHAIELAQSEQAYPRMGREIGAILEIEGNRAAA